MHDLKDLNHFLSTIGIGEGIMTDTFKLGAIILGYKRWHKDIDKWNFWNVDTSSFDDNVAAQWELGNVILKHAICPLSIIMAKDVFVRYINHPETVIYRDYFEWVAESDKILNEMLDTSESIEQSGVLKPGYIYTEHVADGYAYYVVTKVNKKTVVLEHRYFGDGYVSRWLGGGSKVDLEQFMQLSHFGKPSLFGKVAS